MVAPLPWYLIRSKPNRESYVRQRLSQILPEVFMPMLQIPPSSRAPRSVVPLFPQYIFARLDLSAHYFEVRYMPGVAALVSSGHDPLVVSEDIVDGVRSRCTDGVVVLPLKPLRYGDCVRLIGGTLRDFEGIFERYLSGAKRVAILINTLEGSPVRVVTDGSMVVAQ